MNFSDVYWKLCKTFSRWFSGQTKNLASLVGSGGKFFFDKPKPKPKPVGEFEVQKSLGTITGLRCKPLAQPPGTRMMCSNGISEDSICTVICDEIKSGFGMGSQVCACAKMFKGPVMIPLGCSWKGAMPDCVVPGIDSNFKPCYNVMNHKLSFSIRYKF